jgi:hypothetical protein
MQISSTRLRPTFQPTQQPKAASQAPQGDQVTFGSDRISTGARRGRIGGAVVGAGLGAYLVMGAGATAQAVAGGIGGAIVGGGLGMLAIGSLAGSSRSGGEGAVLGLAGGAVGLVGGAIAGGFGGAMGGIPSIVAAGAGAAAGGALLGTVGGFFLS